MLWPSPDLLLSRPAAPRPALSWCRPAVFWAGASLLWPGLLWLSSFGCYRESGSEHANRATVPASRPLRPPIVLISVDTLRADHLPAYGYTGVTTPSIDALRADSILFEHAFCHTPITGPSHVSLLTGLLPTLHGVRDNVAYPYLPDQLPSLPRALREAGYATGGAVSVFLLSRGEGFGHGFDFFDDHFPARIALGPSGIQRAGNETIDAALNWVRTVVSRPFFLFVHLYEPHTPYAPPEPYKSRYAASPYDGEIAAVDAVVGRLLGELKNLGVYDQAMIFLLSDHGEGLGDHGEREHGVLLYRESLQVPLLLKLPANQRAGTTDARVAQLIDVFPTVLAGLGAPAPSGVELPGRSLLTAPPASVANFAETFYPRLHFGWSDLASLIDYPWHFIDGPDPELYHLGNDPGETQNLLTLEKATSRRLREALTPLRRPLQAPAQTTVSAETRAALSALGYLGGAATVHGNDLPDPKSKIRTLDVYEQGIAHMARGDLSSAHRAFRETVAQNPLMVDAWEYLAETEMQQGDGEAALTSYRRALEISGNASYLAVKIAILLAQSGRFAETVAFTREQLVHSPHEIRLCLLESRALLFLERPQEALTVAEQAVHMEPQNADAVYQRGAVQIALRQLGAAERDLRQALALAPDHTAAMSDLAVLLEAQGNLTEARVLLQQVVARNPADQLARRRLAQLGAGG